MLSNCGGSIWTLHPVTKELYMQKIKINYETDIFVRGYFSLLSANCLTLIRRTETTSYTDLRVILGNVRLLIMFRLHLFAFLAHPPENIIRAKTLK